jgi:hypothetical protein
VKQFAVSTRRLETAIEDTQAKAASHRLKSELRKTNIVILRFQAREPMRRSMTGTIVKLPIYLFVRSHRQSGRVLATPGLRESNIRKSSTLGAVSV